MLSIALKYFFPFASTALDMDTLPLFGSAVVVITCAKTRPDFMNTVNTLSYII